MKEGVGEQTQPDLPTIPQPERSTKVIDDESSKSDLPSKVADDSELVDHSPNSDRQTEVDTDSNAHNHQNSSSQADILVQSLKQDDYPVSENMTDQKTCAELVQDESPKKGAFEKALEALEDERGVSESDSSSSDEDTEDGELDTVDHDEADECQEPAREIKSEHEIVAEQVPELPSDFTIASDTAVEIIGKLVKVVDNVVIVQAVISGEFRILDEKSIFCFEDKTPLGLLYEIFGRVQSPLYSVRFNDTDKASSFTPRIGQNVYYVVPESKFILTSTVRAVKGSDASNLHDEEIPLEEQEFSNDEAEMLAKSANKKKKRKRVADPNRGRSMHQQQDSYRRGIPAVPQHAFPQYPNMQFGPHFQQQILAQAMQGAANSIQQQFYTGMPAMQYPNVQALQMLQALQSMQQMQSGAGYGPDSSVMDYGDDAPS